MIKHLKEHDISYIKHFKRAMSMSLALFLHAIIPDLYPHYASNKMSRLD